ncbi:MAG: hypothetical protein E7433_00875 [Ruminococcaceae bacterium]|nr:hypothetical protein [Oscillospiraceae bacterium]
MLTPEQIVALRDRAGELTDPVIEFLIADIADRISEAGHLTSSAAYEVWKAQKLGVSQRQLKKELQKLLKVSSAQVEQLLTQTAKTSYDFDLKRFPHMDAVPFDENGSLQQILDAAIQQAQEDFTNITQTMGFIGPDGRFLELTDAYQRACDFAFEKVVTGAQDYNSAVRDATRGLAEKGIRVLDYATGVHRSLETAVRQNVMGGLGIMNEQISQQNHDLLGCDGWEISAHGGCAPDHEPIQGKQYSDEEYTRLNNSLVRRIGTLNCGHSAMPIILGVNDPQYTDAELEEFRQQNEDGVTYEGKHYTLYEAEQRQRRLETAIRNRKRRILIDERLGDKDALQTDQIRLQLLKQEYSRFSKAANLPMQYERMEAAGFDWMKGRAAENAYKKAVTVNDDADISFYSEAPVDLEGLSSYVDEKLYRYSRRESKWSKTTRIVPAEYLSGARGRKEWSCDITLREDAGFKTVIHEHLHARSVSYYDEDTFVKYKPLEEGCVELFAQEICKVNNIPYHESYKYYVRDLRIINSITRYGDDFKFAKDLFDIPLPDRYNWLRMQIEYAIKHRRMAAKTKDALWQALNNLKGGV